MILIYQGVTSNLFIIVFMILYSTGWFQSKIPLKPQYLLTLLLLYIVLSFIDIPFYKGIYVNLGGFFLPVIIYFFLWVGSISDRIYAFSSSMLIGTIYFSIKVFFRLDPVIIIVDQSLQISLILTIAILFIAQNFINGFNLLLGGLLIGEIFLFLYSNNDSGVELILGDESARDVLIYGILEMWILYYLINSLKKWITSKKIRVWRKKQIHDK